MSDPTVQLALMKLLATKHFPLTAPRKKVKMDRLVEAIKRIGTETEITVAFENMCELKGRGLVNTTPKIIMKDEIDTAEFEVWLTPLGRTELERKLTS